ncbi:MAG: dTDP-glucose 4,6-dehydratase [Omnitrophica WOR_2 bacterium RBG_13_41_10]|nr:MAG: dTDP-glucose 4,6-dehydratase [Omnitrophica WOR_2 bacterium RBG_13_41_10]
MRKRLPKILVTGGAGFMGSEFVRQAINKDCPHRGLSLIVVDNLTYAGDLRRLEEVRGRYKFYKADICDKKKIKGIFRKEKPKVVVHFAAETHVDKSIQESTQFLKTNIKGTQVLLELCRLFKIKKFIQISSDEVYGEIKKGRFSESSPLKPNSPYAASKAAADLLIKSYIRTYNFPAIIVRPCNNYGPWQYPEKLIPQSILKAIKNEKIPIYGRGKNIREWLYVSDCVDAILLILRKGKKGEIYNIGSGQERNNLMVVKQILRIMRKPEKLIKFVKDRPGHDFRYSLDSSKIRKETGWKPRTNFTEGIKLTIDWYLENKKYLTRLT